MKLDFEPSTARRMSPSVMMPSSCSPFITIPTPSLPLLIEMSASMSFISGGMIGRFSVYITSFTRVTNFFPNEPPGWKRAKSRALKSRISISTHAKASPIAIVAVVDDVGARLSGHASRSTLTLMLWVAWRASSESGLPVMLM